MHRLLALLTAPLLLAQAVPSRPMMPDWWVPTAGSGWIALAPIKDRPHLVIPVTLNGRPGWALVDTGFEGMVLSKRYADAHVMPLRPAGTTESFGGMSTFFYSSGVTMAIGAVHTKAPGTFAVVDFGAFSDLGGHSIDAIVGMGLLGHVAWQVDEDGRRMRFLPTGSLAWTAPAPARSGPRGTRLVTDIDLGRAGTIPAVVDTGSDDHLLVDTALGKRAGAVVLTDIAAGGAGGSFTDLVGRLPRAGVGGLPVADAPVEIGDEVDRVMGDPALVGMSLLSRYNMQVDLPAGHLELRPRVGRATPEWKSTTGLQGWFSKGDGRIVHVMLHSPAAAVGLTEGDTICAVNGRPMSSTPDASRWATAPAGTRHVLTMCDGRRIPLTTRSFY